MVIRLNRRQLLKASATTAGVVATGLPLTFLATPAAAYTVPQKMNWWYAARFGMFIHFGSYSYLGHGEWAFSEENWSKAEYQTEVSANFNPVSFNAATVVGLAKTAGMKYLVITAKHHEGFAMWDSQVPSFTDTTGTKRYTLPSYTPYKADLLAELKAECDRQGIMFGLYYSILDWCHPSQTIQSGINLPFTTMASMTARADYINDMKAHLQELMTRYDPALLWFDGDWGGNPSQPTVVSWWTSVDGLDLYNYLIGMKPSLIVNERVKRGAGLGDYLCPEESVPAAPPSRPWETCRTMNDAWGYNASKEGSYKPVQTLLREMVQVVSRDGNYLLNIGPRGDGVVTAPAVDVLNGMGAWMSVYGDSIYGATASPYGIKPSWGYYTKKSGKLFAHVVTWPSNGQLVIPPLTNTISRVYLLNNPGTSLSYTFNGAGITISLPAAAPNPDVSVVVVEVSGVPTSGPGAGAQVFADANYSGASATLKVGSYTMAQLQAAGIANDSVSSIKVAPGYQVTAYEHDNFTGTAWTFTSNNPDLRPTGNNDVISSLQVTFNPGTYFQIRNVTNSLVVDSGGNVPSGSNLKQWTSGTNTNLQWQAIDLGTGYYRLVNRTNGMVADGWGDTTAGSAVRQAAWNGSNNNQQWSITDLGGGTYRIANRTTGLVFDGGGQVSSGSVLKQYTSVTSTNLQWGFEPAA